MSEPPIDRRTFLSATAGAAVAGSLARDCEAARPRSASRKKGFCTVVRDDQKWLERITALDAKWFYSWGKNKPSGVPEGVEFCPMIWGAWEGTVENDVAKLTKAIEAGEVERVMGFNEPDQHDQSDLSVERVVELWPLLMELDVPLASPGCVHPDRDWMKQFMAEADKRDYRVDYVCVHSYGGTSVDAFMHRMEKVHKMYDRPLWLTEFAVGDWKARKVEENRHSAKKVRAFMRELLPQLEKADFIDRYAWFSASPNNRALGTSALFDDDGELTQLGRIYRAA